MHIAIIISLVVVVLLILIIGLYFAFRKSSPSGGLGTPKPTNCTGCKANEYCDEVAVKCMNKKPPGSICGKNTECDSGGCLKGSCVSPDGTWPTGSLCHADYKNQCVSGTTCSGTPLRCRK